VSHELSRAGVEHVVLEKDRVGETWRRRWDSFCLVTPNWSVLLPGHPYDRDDPDGFMSREEEYRSPALPLLAVGALSRHAPREWGSDADGVAPWPGAESGR
jgi:hypothetical protein